MAGATSMTVTVVCPVALSPAALVTMQVSWAEPRVELVNWTCGVPWPPSSAPP